jgi:hypothetical protein
MITGRNRDRVNARLGHLGQNGPLQCCNHLARRKWQDHFLCLAHAAQHLSGNRDPLASAVIEVALTAGASMAARESPG